MENRPPRTPRKNSLLKRILALFFGCALAFASAVLILTFYPSQYNNWRSDFTYWTRDARTGGRPTAGQTGTWGAPCLRIHPVQTNSLGFRGREWGEPSGFEIAVLGDSFMEALQVPDGGNTADILETLLGARVLNTGVSGIGTVTELEIFRAHLKARKPGLVLLFFTDSNDVRNNSCTLEQRHERPGMHPCGVVRSGTVSYMPPQEPAMMSVEEQKLDSLKNSSSAVQAFWKNWFMGSRAWSHFTRDIRDRVSGRGRAHRAPDGLEPAHDWNVYVPPASPEWRQAWDITEKALTDLNREVQTSGGTLVVVTVPQYLNYSRNWRGDVRTVAGIKTIPGAFDPGYPLLRLQQAARRNSIRLLALEPWFMEYRDKFNLQTPYFGYRCEGHWNPVGHFTAASRTALYLLENGLVPDSPDTAARIRRIRNNLKLSPEQILGRKAFGQIYGKGLYRGASRIPQLLKQ